MMPLTEIEGHLCAAHEEIGDVAANVGERWRMSIPARPDYDTDLIISRALDGGEALAYALRAVLAVAAGRGAGPAGVWVNADDIRDAITEALA